MNRSALGQELARMMNACGKKKKKGEEKTKNKPFFFPRRHLHFQSDWQTHHGRRSFISNLGHTGIAIILHASLTFATLVSRLSKENKNKRSLHKPFAFLLCPDDRKAQASNWQKKHCQPFSPLFPPSWKA
jgi:hypothetical protein